MLEAFKDPVVLASLIALFGVVLGLYWKTHRTSAQAADTIASAAQSLIKDYVEHNKRLNHKVDELAIKLEECLVKHAEAEREIDELTRRIESLEKQLNDYNS